MYAPQPAGMYGGSYNIPYQNANMMQWENLNKTQNMKITKATWLHTLTVNISNRNLYSRKNCYNNENCSETRCGKTGPSW